MSGKRKYGVTKPISMIGPNETDLHRTRQLEEFLVSAGLYESLEDGALRKEVLAQIDLIAKAWVKRITHERGYGEQLVEEENAKIYTFGSLSFVGADKIVRIQKPKSRKAESCTSKCVGTCIRGGAGAPGEGPLNVRRPLVVFKNGFRSRQYCLIECSDICNLINDGDDGP